MKNWFEKIKYFDKRMDFMTLGFLLAMGFLVVSGILVLIINYLFTSTQGYSKIILIFIYVATTLSFYNMVKSLDNNFITGYIIGIIVLVLSVLLWEYSIWSKILTIKNLK